MKQAGNLKQRWIDAMLTITFSLINGKTLTGEMGIIVCRCFNEDAPEHPTREVVESLEAEALRWQSKTLPKIEKPQAEIISEIVKRKHTVPKAVAKRKITPNPNDYPTPWCMVRNDIGDVIRYEDANGRIIPKILWPSQ